MFSSNYCYDRALLPSIICLGRLRIASKYIFNLWQLRQGVDSLAQWLEHWIFNREDRVRIPRSAGNFFSYASFLCYGFHVVRWGLVRNRTLFSRKWLRVIKNDDFLKDRVRIPRSAGNFFSYASFLCCDFHVVRLYTVKGDIGKKLDCSLLLLLLSLSLSLSLSLFPPTPTHTPPSPTLTLYSHKRATLLKDDMVMVSVLRNLADLFSSWIPLCTSPWASCHFHVKSIHRCGYWQCPHVLSDM